MKTFIIGAVLAAAAGMFAGSALQPSLALNAPPMQPVPAGIDAYDEAQRGGWSYDGDAPDHVLGTDWLARESPAPPPVVVMELPPAETPDPPSVEFKSEFDLPAPTPATPEFPSEQGDILSGFEAPAAEPPPAPDR